MGNFNQPLSSSPFSPEFWRLEFGGLRENSRAPHPNLSGILRALALRCKTPQVAKIANEHLKKSSIQNVYPNIFTTFFLKRVSIYDVRSR